MISTFIFIHFSLHFHSYILLTIYYNKYTNC